MLATVLSLALMLPADDSGAHVRDILATKCAQCHGPNLAHSKVPFGMSEVRAVALGTLGSEDVADMGARVVSGQHQGEREYGRKHWRAPDLLQRLVHNGGER